MTAAPKAPLAAMLNLTDDEYSAYPALRCSLLKEILRSPAHFRHALENPREQTPAMRLGSDIHTAILEPLRFRSSYVVSQKFDRRTKDGKAQAEAFEAANAGKVIVDEETYKRIDGCVQSVYQNELAKAELVGGRAEAAFIWNDFESGIDCKAKPDFLRERERVLVDVKTTSDASPAAFSRDLAKYLYHVQAAYYLDGVSAVAGTRFDTFRIVAVETTAPFAVAVYELNSATIEKGRELYRRALHNYAECRALDAWPTYSNHIKPIGIPNWAFIDGGDL